MLHDLSVIGKTESAIGPSTCRSCDHNQKATLRELARSGEEVRSTLKIRGTVLVDDPPATLYGCGPSEPCPPTHAVERSRAGLDGLRRRIEELT
jgi:hypothetical protein